MSDSSHVDITALGDVGITLMMKLMPGHESRLGDAEGKIAQAQVGAAGTSEAHQLAAWYAGATDALGQFLGDVRRGLHAHGNTAVVMSYNYRHGDLGQGDAMSDVYRATHPSAGEPSLASEDDAAQHAGKTPPNSGKNYLNSKGDTKAPKAHGLTPQQQVLQHEHKYGKQEHWHPVDPSPPIDPNNMPA